MTHQHRHSTSLACAACHTPRLPGDLIPLSVVRPAIQRRLNAVYPEVNPEDRVCLSCINRAISDEIDLTIEQERQDFVSMNADASSASALRRPRPAT